MLTTGERQKLCQIEQDLRDADRGFAWRLTVLEGILRWDGPGRRSCLLALAVLAAALPRLVAAVRRLLMAVAAAPMPMGLTALMALGDTAWPGWESGQAQVTVPARPGRPRSDSTGPR